MRTPIGSKLVFEKWSDGSDDYVAINLVYPKYSQMHARTLLSLEEPPMVQPVTIEGLTANSDGLYRLTDLDNRMAEAMAEYDAIEDIPTAVTSATRTVTTSDERSYTLSGTPAFSLITNRNPLHNRRTSLPPSIRWYGTACGFPLAKQAE